MGPYEIFKQVRKVAFELNLPTELIPVHLVFDVSILKKCVCNPLSILWNDGLGVDENLIYEEFSVEIRYFQNKNLRNKEVASVKISIGKPSS